MSEASEIRVLLAEDQDLVRAALSALLNLEADIEVVATVGRGDEVIEAVEEHAPDVALLDIEMPGMGGLDVAAALREQTPSTRVLMVTTFGRPGYVRRALEAGASGFLVKDTPPEKLCAAIRRVHAGLRVVDSSLAEESLVTGANPLTEREAEICRATSQGQGPSEVATTLHLSPGTVRNHMSSIMRKTGGRNSFDAARIATDHGWI